MPHEALRDIRLESRMTGLASPQCAICSKCYIEHPTGACRTCRKGKPKEWTTREQAP